MNSSVSIFKSRRSSPHSSRSPFQEVVHHASVAVSRLPQNELSSEKVRPFVADRPNAIKLKHLGSGRYDSKVYKKFLGESTRSLGLESGHHHPKEDILYSIYILYIFYIFYLYIHFIFKIYFKNKMYFILIYILSIYTFYF